jgi:hypothetical protein
MAWMRELPWRDDAMRFDRLARALFAVQYAHCTPYARFCRMRGVVPEQVKDWREIPAVPAGAFKELALRCFPEAATRKTFRTSGTSGHARGELHLDTLALYESSLLPTLEQLLFRDPPTLPLAPDERPASTRQSDGRPSPRWTIRVLAPSPEEAPDSSLSHMFGVLLRKLGSAESGFDVERGALGVDDLIARLNAAQRDRIPVALCGTAFAFVHLLEELEARDLALICAPGSRIMETGGFKGRSREMPRDELYSLIEARLGVPPSQIVNQYGMTELGSQFYDSVIVDPTGPRRKLGPPWARVRFIDPETRTDVAEGEVGMVVIHDLANTGSVAAIETADLGRRITDETGAPIGFEILGRDPSAEARGCSIAADSMLAGP